MLSMVACFVAVEVGSLVVCVGIALFDTGPLAILEGIVIWAGVQPVILLIALFSMPFGALIRMILGLALEQPRGVAVVSGAVVGLIGSALFAGLTNAELFVWPPIMAVGLVSGLAGGWAWWRVEKPFLDRKKQNETA